MHKTGILTWALAAALTACAGAEPEPAADAEVAPGRLTVLPVSAVDWQALNPARGDQSPRAGTLWGDRHGPVPTGFLAKFVDGFSSPPHIHNATYRAVVIDGLVHNDDPAAETLWMPAGSFWTQPKGEVHITSAQGSSNIALVEIDEGPYLVRPPDQAFDSGERPVNIVPSNLVWVAPPGFAMDDAGPRVSYLWGRLDAVASNGTFLKLPAGFRGEIRSDAEIFRAVVIQGPVRHAGADPGDLPPGSYFSSEGPFTHAVSTEAEAVLYIRTVGQYAVVESAPPR
ncbi:MAG: DUF4437 domain-containing protein [Acidobacteriota bacterium]